VNNIPQHVVPNENSIPNRLTKLALCRWVKLSAIQLGVIGFGCATHRSTLLIIIKHKAHVYLCLWKKVVCLFCFVLFVMLRFLMDRFLTWFLVPLERFDEWRVHTELISVEFFWPMMKILFLILNNVFHWKFIKITYVVVLWGERVLVGSWVL